MKRISLILLLFLVLLLALTAFPADRRAAEPRPSPEPQAASPEAAQPVTEPEESPQPAPLSMGEPPLAPEPDYSLVISEVMSHNRAALAGDADSFPDWVELLNTGTETLSLDGLCLQCGERRWELPALTAQPGAYVLLLCEEDTAFSTAFISASFTDIYASDCLGIALSLPPPHTVATLISNDSYSLSKRRPDMTLGLALPLSISWPL